MPQFPEEIYVSTLDGTNGFRLDGIDAYDQSGWSVASAGDVNGDGYDDVIIGARFGAPGGDSGAGESYVVFGKASGWSASIDLSALDGTNGFRLDGIDGSDLSGFSVASAGDVNGDGFDDVIIGAIYADPGGDGIAGETYVVFGKASGWTASIDLATLDGSNGFRLDGIDQYDRSGWSVDSAGDVNGDGLADIVVGAKGADRFSGETYVIFGKESGWSSSLDLSTLDGTNGFKLDGARNFDDSGWSVASAGDFNGDGFDDIVIGAPYSQGSEVQAGETYVVFGKASGWSAALSLAALDGTNGFRIDGEQTLDRSGWSVASAGDINGDGFDDVLIGAIYADGASIYSGAAYVIFGASGPAANLNLSDLNGDNGFRINGIASLDLLGSVVGSAGDVNGDGFDDIIVRASNNNGAGTVYVVLGRSGSWAAQFNLTSLNGANGFRILGLDAYDNFGRSVGSAGDVNGDGFDDILIGANEADPGGDQNAGESYVLFGRATSPWSPGPTATSGADLYDGDDTNELASGGDGEDILVGNGGSDTLYGDAGDDVIAGRSGSDSLDGGADADTVDYSTSATGVSVNLVTGTVSGGDAAGDTIAGFEHAIGGSANDMLTGTSGANALTGGAGDDTLTGGSGVDSLDGGADVDTTLYSDAAAGVNVNLNSGTGTGDAAQGDVLSSIENVSGGNFNDTLTGAHGVANWIGGGFGDDSLNGFSGNDTIVGGSGNDTLIGNFGADVLDGGAGTDIAVYSDATVRVVVRLWNGTGEGNLAQGDVLTNIENLAGSNFNDILFGADGVANWISGGNGPDYLNGLSGNDTLVGGAGNDSLAGGSGADRLDFSAGSGADRVFNMITGAGVFDVIRITGYGAALDSFAEILAATTQVGADAVINLGGGNTITLVNTLKTSLVADDFTFI